jgi:4-aminobutyrate aminotransferase-like enzyme
MKFSRVLDGSPFGFQNYDVVPDIVVMGKGMGWHAGAFTASHLI